MDEGRARLVDGGAADVELSMDISDFSSLVVGAVEFGRLHAYSRATISEEAYVPLVNKLFRAGKPPWCLTHF